MSSTMETKGVATSTFLCYRTTLSLSFYIYIYVYTFIPLKRVVHLILFKYFAIFWWYLEGPGVAVRPPKKLV